MGYCITVECNGMVIPKAKVKKALAAINAIKPGRYSWVDHTGDFESLEDALSEWRYGAVEEDNGNVTIECFNGEKSGDDEKIWQALAPFMKAGAEVEYHGEDGAQWKYVFDGKTYKELNRSTDWV